MSKIPIYFATLFACLVFTQVSIAQDTTVPIQDWKVSAKKTGEGNYELTFATGIPGNWQVYAPNQILMDVKTTELHFTDSSVSQDGDFIAADKPQKIISAIFDKQEINVFTEKIDWKANIRIAGPVPANLQGTLLYTYGLKDEFYPSTAYSFVVALEGGVASTLRIKIPSIDINHPVSDCGDEGTKNKSMLAIFLFGLVGGLIALLTPCVFPMVPVTVTFFTKKSGDKKKGIVNGILYGLFIFLIYVAITIPFHVAGNTRPEIYNNISTNVWLNFIFFAIFVAFALSFFGLFDIALPTSFANKLDSKSGLGNVVGIFFMAATLAIVSFSCTGPILGTLLVGVADAGAWPLTAGAAGFGLALGLPFALFAMFPTLAPILAKIGRMDDRCESGPGIYRTCSSCKVFFQCGPCHAMGPVKKRGIRGVVDRHWVPDHPIPPWKDQVCP